jgi:hypothetical protein
LDREAVVAVLREFDRRRQKQDQSYFYRVGITAGISVDGSLVFIP